VEQTFNGRFFRFTGMGWRKPFWGILNSISRGAKPGDTELGSKQVIYLL
jgi:hypothetical protein